MKESNFHANVGQVNQTIQTKENTMNAMSAMNELSNSHNNSNNSKTMSSREIAELTGKLHFNIMRDIKTLIGQGAFNGFKFEAVEYTDAKGEKRPEYLLDFDATMTLVTGYNAVLRAKVIKRWRELEESVHNTGYIRDGKVLWTRRESGAA